MGIGGDDWWGRNGVRCRARWPQINVLMPIGGRVLCWNYRGAEHDEFHREPKNLIKVHRPLVIILLELRISGEVANGICKKLGMSEWVR